MWVKVQLDSVRHHLCIISSFGLALQFLPRLFYCTINWNCVVKVGFSFPYTILTFLAVETGFLVGFHFGDFWLTFVNCGFSVEV